MERYSLIILIGFVVLCYLQTLFSQLENKYIGLIIPTITFIASIILSISFSGGSFDFVKLIVTLLLINIPTLVFMLIYKRMRKKLQ